MDRINGSHVLVKYKENSSEKFKVLESSQVISEHHHKYFSMNNVNFPCDVIKASNDVDELNFLVGKIYSQRLNNAEEFDVSLPTFIPNLQTKDDSYKKVIDEFVYTTFSIETLATHSVRGTPLKPALDQILLRNIVNAVVNMYGVSEDKVFKFIAFRCHTEDRNYKRRLKRLQR